MQKLTRLFGFVEKGWGSEFIFASTNRYCGKLLNFNKNAKFSMHFHAEKEETWLVLSGEFIVKYIDTKDATIYEKQLKKNDVWHNNCLLPHQLICVKKGTIVEVSTADSVEDNYRVFKGDSQK